MNQYSKISYFRRLLFLAISAVLSCSFFVATAPSVFAAGATTTTLPPSISRIQDNSYTGIIHSSIDQLYLLTNAQDIKSAIINPGNSTITFTNKAGMTYMSSVPPQEISNIGIYLASSGVSVSTSSSSATPTTSSPSGNSSSSGPGLFGNIIFIILAVVILFSLYAFILKRRAQGVQRHIDARSSSSSSSRKDGKNKNGSVEIPETRFSDVAGVDEALADLEEFVQFLREPERFSKVGAEIPKGALLCGPPGTGKTLLARAVAGEAGCAFFTASGADFSEIYVGVGPKRVRELFEKARKVDRAIIFIDEVDAVAKKRSDSTHGGDSERDSTLIALLNEMDGFHKSNVIVLAATNRADILDPALTRPGRLDRKVEVPLPDRRGRQRIFEIHAERRPITENVDFDNLARRTSGMSGADISGVVNEAAIEAARRGIPEVPMDCFEHAIATVSMGRARHSAIVPDADREVTAWHEAGHTVCAYVQESADKPVSVSIIPRGPAGGVTWMAEGDELFMKRSKAHARLVTALGGRAAEELLLGSDFTQGAYGDLMSATELATNMAARFGMTDLGLMVRDPERMLMNKELHDVVEKMLTTALEEARRLLNEHIGFVEGLVSALLDNDTLDSEQIHAVYNGGELPIREPIVYAPIPVRVEIVEPIEAVESRAPESRVKDNPSGIGSLLPRFRRKRRNKGAEKETKAF